MGGLMKREFWVVISMFLAFAMPLKARGDEAQLAPSLAASPERVCLFVGEQRESSCDLTAFANGFRIVIGEGDKAGLLLLRIIPATETSIDPNLIPSSNVNVESDLEAGITAQSIDPDDAQTILSELRENGDLTYVMPRTRQSLRNELGFNTETPLASVDFLELVRVHIQIALGLSPMTSSYLAEKLGMVVRAPASPSETASIVSSASPNDAGAVSSSGVPMLEDSILPQDPVPVAPAAEQPIHN
jgi:hypothetical protein